MIKLRDGALVHGHWKAECKRADGSLKWVEEWNNLVVNEGMDHMLDVTLSADTPITTWYIGLKEAGAPAPGDTLANHPSWAENSNYTGDRKAWTEGGASGQQITNPTPVQFSIDTNGQTIAGAFLCSVATTNTGTLFSAGDFAAPKNLESGETLDVTVTISLS